MKYYKNRLAIYIIILISLSTSEIKSDSAKPYYNVIEYGATADGKTFDTKSIQNAINECTNNGGGTVVFPAGTYLSGEIVMKDNVILNLQVGSKILGSENIKDYHMYSLIWGEKVNNIGVIGFGTIDGQGKSYQGKTSRPSLIKFVNCNDVIVEGVTLQHPGAWTQHYLKCDGVTLRDLKIFAHGAENNDMVDINQSRNVIITGLIGDSDDDGITLKSTGEGLVENVVISDCIIRTRTNGIKAGTESYGGFRNIALTNCYFGPSLTQDGYSGRDEGLAGIALEIVDGGVMENVTISNVVIEETTAPIFIRLGNRSRKYQNLDRRPIGSINNISISNLVAQNASKTGCSIVGEVDHPIKNISISNVKINFIGGGTLAEGLAEMPELVSEYPESIRLGILPAYGFFVRHVEGLTFRDVELTYNNEEHRPAMVVNDVKNLKLLNFNAKIADDALGQLVLQKTENVFISGCSPLSSNMFLRLEQNCKSINVTGNNFSELQKPIYIDETIDIDELNISSNLTGKSTLFEILQPNIERDSLGMVSIYYPENIEIYYTTDGSNPTKLSKKYEKKFEQISPVVIKARAFQKDNTSSRAKLVLKRLSALSPSIFPADQFFNEKIKVKITTNTFGAEIYYTTDGTTPDKYSLKYKNPITIKENSILRALTIKDELVTSSESTSKYEVIEKLEGVQYKYYEARWIDVPNFINLTPKRVGVVNVFELAGLEHRELHFGLVMHGYLYIRNEGDYTFFASTNDGSKLLVDNIEVVNNNGVHPAIEKSGKVYLEKGMHLLELRYFQSGGGKDIKVSWQGPGFEKREMTKDDLSFKN